MFLMQTSNPSISYICPFSLRVPFTLPLKNTPLSLPFSHFKNPSISSSSIPMADYQPRYERPTTDPYRTIPSDKAPSTSHLLALLTLLPIGAFLLFLAGISFIGTVIGLALSSPLLLIFSPILVPAAAVIALAVAGFLASGAFGVTALSSLWWMANNLRRSRVPLQLEQAKQWVRERAAQEAQSGSEAGEAIESKAQDGGKTEEVGPGQGEGEEGARAQEGGSAAQEKGSAKDERAQEGDKAEAKEERHEEASPLRSTESPNP